MILLKDGKTRIFLKGLEALSSKGTPEFAEPDKKDYGKRKPGAKPVRQVDPTKTILKKGGKIKRKKKKKKGKSFANLTAAQKQVYRRGLAAYMSSGNRPKVSQHAWAMARVKSAFGKREAAKIAAGKGKKKKKK
tara:strand:- start:238 stop:639 length:402 start_codon:yes stop_codon:yes gene_type:complete